MGDQQRSRQHSRWQGPQSARDTRADMEISLYDVFTGDSRTVNIDGERVKVKIPKGIKDGKRIRLKGKGQSGVRGGQRGDLYITIHIRPDNRFKRDGDDLYHTHDIDLYTAVLGGKTHVPTMDGNKVKLQIPPGTQNGKLFRLGGLGMPKFKHNNERGDLYVRANVKIPKNLSDEEKQKFRELARMRGKKEYL